MLRMIVFSLLLLAPLCTLASYGQEVPEAVGKLVGGDEKAWIYERFETYMGDRNKCRRGESWTFYRGGRVVIKKCDGGRVTVEEKRWDVERKSSIDVALKVGDVEYLLLFAPPKPRSAREKMILRQKADVKTEKTKDFIFYHEVD
jgi:hypothetical protein